MKTSHKQLTRTESARTLTCIEAFDTGFEFVLQCSGCDYYNNNRALNAIALKNHVPIYQGNGSVQNLTILVSLHPPLN